MTVPNLSNKPSRPNTAATTAKAYNTRRPDDSRMAKATKNSRRCVGQRFYQGACASARRSSPLEKE